MSKLSVVIASYIESVVVVVAGLVRWLGGYGVGLVINRSRVQLPAMHCRVST